MNRIGGVDGCRGGWLRIERAAGKLVAAAVTTERLFDEAPEFAVLAVDIPIGLSEHEPREVDRLARRLLGRPRASSVFPAPVRAALEGTTYGDVCSRSYAASGRKLSQQAFAILSKIREIDTMLLGAPHLIGRVREVHPEISFYFMNGERPMAHSKKTAEGRAEREALLTAHFGESARELRLSARSTVPLRIAAVDDFADAMVALWSAERVAAGASMRLAGDTLLDPRGLPMEMVA